MVARPSHVRQHLRQFERCLAQELRLLYPALHSDDAHTHDEDSVRQVTGLDGPEDESPAAALVAEHMVGVVCGLRSPACC